MKAFYYEIEPYAIRAYGYELTVLPMNDGVYRVFSEGNQIADLYPEITDAGIYWNGFGHLSPRLAEEIGIQIFACEI
ncbi:hypothetical protein [Pedobacter steynii]